MSSKAEMLRELLQDLSRATQGNVQASLLVSKSQGLTICVYMADSVPKDSLPEEDVIAARSTQIEMATRGLFKQLKKGELSRMLFEGETGYVVISNAGDDALLAVITNKKVNLGLLFFMMSRTVNKIVSIL
ncbi:MAG: roadblock/LC7 domain-containing protein [Candidatus Thorarchaeota archaeon]